MRIFCLEDEIDNLPRKQIKQILESLGHTLTIAKSKDEGVKLYPGGQPYDMLLLDHDMRGFFDSLEYDNTGTGFVKWLVGHPQVGDNDDPEVVLHSQNLVGRKSMRSILAEAGFRVREFPFGPEYVAALREFPLCLTGF